MSIGGKRRLRVFVVGSSSFLGTQLIDYIGSQLKVKRIGRLESCDYYLELSRPNDFDYSIFHKGDVVIFLAAISSPDICNKQYEYAYSVNVTGTEHFINKSIECGCKVLFYSSDTVYGDSINDYDELSSCNPLGNYGMMKYQVEEKFKNCSAFKVFRLSYVVSNGDKYTRYLKSCLLQGADAEIFDPFMRSVVFIDDLFEATVNLIQRWDEFEYKIVNVCGQDLVSRVELAENFRRYCGGNMKYKIVDPPAGFFDARPKILRVKSLYIEKLLGRKQTKISEVYRTQISYGVEGE